MTSTLLEPDMAFAVPASAHVVRQAITALEARNFTVHIADTVAEARSTLAGLLPTEAEIFTAGSETLRLSGIADDINTSGKFRSVRTARLADLDPASVEARRIGATPDVVVGSAHALTADGQIVVASASGSQLSAYAAGAGEVFLVIGAQKIVPDLATALRRVETYALPLESKRMMGVRGRPSAIGKLLIMRLEMFPGRTTVIISREPIGF